MKERVRLHLILLVHKETSKNRESDRIRSLSSSVRPKSKDIRSREDSTSGETPTSYSSVGSNTLSIRDDSRN